MDIWRIQLRWTGFVGAPGYSAFHFAGGGGLISDAQQVADRVLSAASRLSNVLPDVVRLDVDPEAQRINSETGEVLGYEALDMDGGYNGSIAGPYSASSGAVVNWRTDDLRFGRRIRGRTFVVPIGGTQYDDTGTLSGDALDDLNAFADVLVGGDLDSEFGVWSRPRNGSGGVFATVTSHNVPDKAAVLRSRRD